MLWSSEERKDERGRRRRDRREAKVKTRENIYCLLALFIPSPAREKREYLSNFIASRRFWLSLVRKIIFFPFHVFWKKNISTRFCGNPKGASRVFFSLFHPDFNFLRGWQHAVCVLVIGHLIKITIKNLTLFPQLKEEKALCMPERKASISSPFSVQITFVSRFFPFYPFSNGNLCLE